MKSKRGNKQFCVAIAGSAYSFKVKANVARRPKLHCESEASPRRAVHGQRSPPRQKSVRRRPGEAYGGVGVRPRVEVRREGADRVPVPWVAAADALFRKAAMVARREVGIAWRLRGEEGAPVRREVSGPVPRAAVVEGKAQVSARHGRVVRVRAGCLRGAWPGKQRLVRRAQVTLAYGCFFERKFRGYIGGTRPRAAKRRVTGAIVRARAENREGGKVGYDTQV